MTEKSRGVRSSFHPVSLLGVALIIILVLAACSGQSNSPAATALPTENTTNEVSSSNEEPTTGEAPLDPEAEPTEEMTEVEPTEEMAEADSSDGPVSFSGDVFPILQSRCSTCHGGDRIENGFVLLSYDELMAGGESGLVILPDDAANSLLVQFVTEGKMPKRGANLTPVQVQMITDWVNQGALDN
jgi:mono/diheme cytochrome c family protein